MKNLKRRALPALLALTLLLGTGVAVASGGSKKDPLVTLSYLEDTVIPEILDLLSDETKSVTKELKTDLSDQIKDYEKEMEALVSGTNVGSETYVLVTLTKGQTLELDVGCELMLRVGTATVSAATSPALIDVTTGGSNASGSSLEKNHLYMATIADRAIVPTADTVKLLVRGGYTLLEPAPAAAVEDTVPQI